MPRQENEHAADPVGALGKSARESATTTDGAVLAAAKSSGATVEKNTEQAPSPMDAEPSASDALATFESWLDQTRAGLSRVTIAIVGKAGVGKSTLVNALFGESLAAAGAGAPITGRLTEYRPRDGHITLIDSPGLLVGTDLAVVASEIEALQRQRTRAGVDEGIHAIWFCIGQDLRFDPAEVAAVKRLSRIAPTVVILTQVLDPNDDAQVTFRARCQAAFARAEGIVEVLAVPRTIGGVVVAEHGLDALVATTIPALPDGARRAFIVAQRHALEAKVLEARSLANRRAREVRALPVRNGEVDHVNVTKIQARMLADISLLFGVALEAATTKRLVDVVTSGIGQAGGLVATVGRWLAEQGVPLADLAGTLVTKSAAGAATEALGYAFAGVCRDVVEAGSQEVDQTALLHAMQRGVAQYFRKDTV